MLIKKNRKFLSLFMSIIIVISFLPLNAFAFEINPKKDWYNDNSSATTFTISTADELAGFAALVNSGNDFAGKTVKLTADIILNDNPENYTKWYSEYENADPENTWVPIGNETNSFKGTFDGNNHTVSGIFIRSNGLYNQGLFGVCEGTIKNTGIINSYIRCNTGAGGIVGKLKGTVENCYNAGNISSANAAGGIVGNATESTITGCYNVGSIVCDTSEAGGIIGTAKNTDISWCYNANTVYTEFGVGGIIGFADTGNNISYSYNTGNVKGDRRIGGIAGTSYSDVSYCYNLAPVTEVMDYGTDNTYGYDDIGGISGYQNSQITNCYNLGTITGGNAACVGGIAGEVVNGKASNCYSLGSVTGRYKIGGIAGYANMSVPKCYYDSSVVTISFGSTLETNVNNGYGTVLTAENMKNIANLTGLDTSVWANAPTQYATNGVFSASNPVNKGYPVLKAFGYTGVETSIDTQFAKDSAYLIKNTYQLDLVRNYLGDTNAGKIFKLANNIDLSPALYNKAKDTDGSWQPIGTEASQFTGTLDGDGHTINNIYINDTATDYRGLVSFNSGTIKNLGLVNGYIKGNDNIGAVAGQNNGTITSCYNTSEVSGADKIGGVAGINKKTISNCSNTGKVSGTNETGGLAGTNYSEITNSFNTGIIKGTFAMTGGLAGSGYSDSNITNSYNTGAVNGKNAVGGLVGTSLGTIRSCYNTGTITSTGANKGAVAGTKNNGTISNCYYSGSDVAIGGTGASQTGTTPFVQNLTLKLGNNAVALNQPVWGTANALGAGFAFNLNNLTSPIANGVGSDVQATSIGTSPATGKYVITQNELTNSGFTGSAKLITLPAAFTVKVEKASPKLALLVMIKDDKLTIQSTITNCFNPTGNVVFKNGETTIGASSIAANGKTAIEYTVKGGETLNLAAEYAGDTNNNSAKVSLTYNVAKFEQSTFKITNAESTVTIGDKFAVATTGGSGSGAVTYSSSNKDVLDVNSTTGEVTATGIGTAVITANKVGNSNYNDATANTSVITVQKTSPTIGLLASTAGNIATIAASLINSFNPTGDISFKIGSSSIGTSSINASGTAVISYPVSGGESLNITAEYQGDEYNSSVTSNVYKYDVSKFSQNTLYITNAPATLTIGASSFVVATTGGSGSGEVTYATNNASVLAVNATTGKVDVVGVGNATITATKAGDSNYNSISASTAIIDVKKATPTITISASIKDKILTMIAAITNGFNPTGNIAFNSGTTVLGISSINAGGIATANYTVKGGEALNITAEYLGDESNNKVTSSALKQDIAKLEQVEFRLMNVPAKLTVGDSKFTLFTSGGSGSGEVTYSSSNVSVLAVNAATGEATVVGAGTTTITATKAGDSNYNSTSANIEIVVNPNTNTNEDDSSSDDYSSSPSTPTQEAANTVAVVEAPASIKGNTSAVAVSTTSNAFSQPVEIEIKDDATAKTAIEAAIKASKASLSKDAKIFALDISVYAQGTDTKVQPKAGEAVEITMPIPTELLAEKDNLVVVCVTDGKLQVLASRIIEKDGNLCVVFKANHFSPYALVVDKTGKLTAPTKANPPTGIN